MRLIDADALIKRHCKDCASVQKEEPEGCEYCLVVREAKKAPTVDAVPVEHGKWKERHLPADTIMTTEETWYMCSVCYATYSDVDGFRYCPYCGAKMDGGADGETN